MVSLKTCREHRLRKRRARLAGAAAPEHTGHSSGPHAGGVGQLARSGAADCLGIENCKLHLSLLLPELVESLLRA